MCLEFRNHDDVHEHCSNAHCSHVGYRLIGLVYWLPRPAGRLCFSMARHFWQLDVVLSLRNQRARFIACAGVSDQDQRSWQLTPQPFDILSDAATRATARCALWCGRSGRTLTQGRERAARTGCIVRLQPFTCKSILCVQICISVTPLSEVWPC